MLNQGTCICECDHEKTSRVGWVDALTGRCRPCELETGERWGHNTTPAEEGQQVQVDPAAPKS